MNNYPFVPKRITTLILAIALFGFVSFGVDRITSYNNGSLLNPEGIQNNVTKILEDQVYPLLTTQKNTFTLIKPNPFVSQAGASDYSTAVSAAGSVDLDTGEILYSKNLDKRLPIASITKVMTAVVALDLAKGDEHFTVTDYASRQIPTRIGVVPNEKMALKELLAAILLTSANDAASVIQEGVDHKYGAPVFIRAMNEKAKFLGLNNTSFANPQGFDDPNNYSTVEDLAILSRYALTNYPLIQELAREGYAFLPADKNHKQFDLINWNGLIGVYPSTIGMKIGNTGRAGKTTVVISERGGKRILAVVLGADDLYERDLVASQLLDLGYRKTLDLPPINVTREQLRQKYLSWNY